KYSVSELFYRGAHIFSNRFTREDGFGEALDGPRRSTLALAGNPYTQFLRFNGLDAQSCQECHNVLGMQEFGHMAMPREIGLVGSSGGFAQNVFIFTEPNGMTNGIVRNPPRVFRLGYVQRLAEEMTAER